MAVDNRRNIITRYVESLELEQKNSTTHTKYYIAGNGRIYDASLGRFMRAYPFIAQAANLQNYNRYVYANNIPLSYTDLTGFFLKKLFKNKIFRVAVWIGLAAWGGGAFADFLINNQIGWFTKFSGAFSDGWILTAAGKGTVGVAGGFAGALDASGADLQAPVNGGITGGLFGLAGTVGVTSPGFFDPM